MSWTAVCCHAAVDHAVLLPCDAAVLSASASAAAPKCLPQCALTCAYALHALSSHRMPVQIPTPKEIVRKVNLGYMPFVRFKENVSRPGAGDCCRYGGWVFQHRWWQGATAKAASPRQAGMQLLPSVPAPPSVPSPTQPPSMLAFPRRLFCKPATTRCPPPSRWGC